MSGNSKLGAARKDPQDEFYTMYDDIQAEMNAYIDYNRNTFRDKVVFLPCDDPEKSNFTKFFAQNFERYGLRKLISTSYATGVKSKKKWEVKIASSDEKEDEEVPHGHIYILERDVDGNGRIDFHDIESAELDGDGDFRSEEIKRYRDEADIIVTNPPFSLLQQFFIWLFEANKQFIILGTPNAVTYKEVFPHIKDNTVWIGATAYNCGMYFYVPNDFKYKETYKFEKVMNGRQVNRVSSVCWFTNIEHGNHHEPMPLLSMEDNLMYSSSDDLRGRKEYFRYANYDAIEVPIVEAIPSDYNGIMGVPKTFIGRYCPEQFEIIGIAEGDSGRELGLEPVPKDLKKTYKELRDGQLYYFNDDGVPVKPYARILIRRR